MPEQAFLAKNYDENSKKGDRDPRGAFRNPQDFAGAAAGIVGPLGTSSFSLPSVERALTEMESGMGGGGMTMNLGDAASRRLAAGRANTTVGRPGGLPSISPTNISAARTPVSPGGTSATSPGGGSSQHEVLHNFFQSLLSTKDRGGGGSARSSPAKPNGNNTEEGS